MEQFTRHILRKYDTIRGLSTPSEECRFWDVVVITTSDSEQKIAYDRQIQAKLERGELPGFCDYVVTADPPGCKCGNGGATLSVLSHLRDRYGDKLYDLCVLLLHSGGQSQRLPSASVPGKIFTLLPFGEPLYQMIDLQLAMYIPFVARMISGVLLTSSDVILTYDLEGYEDSFTMSGITALAHISPIAFGRNHGVYVTEKGLITDLTKKVDVLKCSKVLQKPTDVEMIKSGAVLQLRSECGDKDFIYTDSSFSFDHTVTKLLLTFYDTIKPLTCEIDAYGDFLQALGSHATTDYIYNARNIASVSRELVDIRKRLFDMLQGTDFTVLALNDSMFMHIGTTKEYLHHFSDHPLLTQTHGFSKHSFCSVGKSTIDGCVLHSSLCDESVISDKSIVEFSHFDVPIVTDANSVISNCQLLKHEVNNGYFDLDNRVVLPPNVFVHTIPILYKNQCAYVTIFFGINDDLKSKPKVSDHPDQIHFLNSTLGHFAEVTNIPISTIIPDPKTPQSLWECTLFPVCKTMSESFLLTTNILSNLVSIMKSNQDHDRKTHDLITHDQKTRDQKTHDLSHFRLMSTVAVLKHKNLDAMLAYRDNLHAIINEKIGG